VKHVRTLAGILVLSAVAAACSSGSTDEGPQGLRGTQDETVAAEEATPDFSDTIQAADAAMAAVEADCSSRGPNEVNSLPGEDWVGHVFTGPEEGLRCANLVDVDMRGAVVGPTATERTDGGEVVRIDFSGADLSGADLRDAKLSITAVGANFSGADLRGADLLDSDLRGANFSGADLRGSRMSLMPGGLTNAVLTGATIGCNVLIGGPKMMLDGVVHDTACGAQPAYYNRTTLAGVLDEATLDLFDFTDVLVQVTSFRFASLTGADLADMGVWPDDTDFEGARLNGADLSGTGFFGADFTDAVLTDAVLTETYWEGVAADGADLQNASMTGFWAVRSSFQGADLGGADLSGGKIEKSDLTGADFVGTNRSEFYSTLVICPDGKASEDEVGRCDFDTPVSEVAPATTEEG
jgi:uncharacterized protein YjbI with pentapeptide repeats